MRSQSQTGLSKEDTTEYDLVTEKKKSCHLQQYGWTLKALLLVLLFSPYVTSDSCDPMNCSTWEHLTCLLRHLIAGQEATVRTAWFQIGKGVRQGCILSLCLFNSYAGCSMGNAVLDNSQPGIKIAQRNINNLRYADDTTLMAESEKELKSLLMRVKKEWKSWLETQHLKN